MKMTTVDGRWRRAKQLTPLTL